MAVACRAGLLALLVLVPLLAGCVAPDGPAFEAGAPGDTATGEAHDDAAPPATVPPAPGDASAADRDDDDAAAEPPGLTLALIQTAMVAAGRIGVNGTLLVDAAPTRAHELRLAWLVDAAPLAEETIAWGPEDGEHRIIVREWSAPPGAAVLRLEAYWDDATRTVASVELEVVVGAGLRLVLNASAAYTQDVGQPTFYSDWQVPFLPWETETGKAVLERASLLKGFPIDLVYHADLEAHYVRMINHTEETWVVPGVVSRSWMILLNGELAGSAIDHVVPAEDDVLELRYVQCFSTGQCQGLGR